jgi:hypothetical protein
VNRVLIYMFIFIFTVFLSVVPAFGEERETDSAMSLHQAIVNGDVNEVESILSRGMDVNIRNRRNWTPLHTAVDGQQKEIVQLLLDKNADVNLTNNNGETPIHLAVKSGQKGIVELLIEKGADLNITNARFENALSLAKKAGHTEIAELLVSHGAKEPDLGREMDRNRIINQRRAMERTGPSGEGIRDQTGQMQAQQEPEIDILADPNEIRANIKKFEGLEKSLEEVAGKSRIGLRHWQRIKTDNRNSLVRVVLRQFDEEVEFIQKVALEEKAKKTADTADSLMKQRKERTVQVLRELSAQMEEQSQSRSEERVRSRSSRGRGAGSQDGRHGRYSARGTQSSGGRTGETSNEEQEQEEQLDAETQNEIELWLGADAQDYDSKLSLANSVHEQTLAEYFSIRKVAEQEKAQKTIATIDGLLLAREERLDELTKYVEEEKQKLEEQEQEDQPGRTRAGRRDTMGQESQSGSRRRRR